MQNHYVSIPEAAKLSGFGEDALRTAAKTGAIASQIRKSSRGLPGFWLEVASFNAWLSKKAKGRPIRKVTVELPVTVIAQLTEASKQTGLAKAEIMRQAIAGWLENNLK